jgi:hypothetical protein
VVNGDADVAQPADARAFLSLRSARPVVAGLLLLIVIAGIGAASPAVSPGGPWHHDALAIGIGLELVLAGLEIALVVMARRTPAAGQPAPALRSVLRRIIAVAMVLIVVIAVVNLIGSRHGDLVQRLVFGNHKTQRRQPPRLPASLRPGAADHIGYVLDGLIGVIVLAALIVCVILVARARTRLRPGGYADELPADEHEDLRQAIDSGRAALRVVDDARAAIIACYVAMEDSLASAGAARAVAETPDELLTRAAAAGVIRGPAATRLTGLFYEARYSTHPVAAAAKDAARQAIDAISVELASRAGAAPAGDEALGATT